MNTFWKEAPFLRILLPFIVGICFFLFFPSSLWWPSALCALLFGIAVGVFSFLSDFNRVRLAFLKGIFIQGMLVSSAYLLCSINTMSSSSAWYKHRCRQFDFAVVRLTESPQEKAKTWKASVEVIQLVGHTNVIQTTGPALVYFKKSSQSARLQEGDEVLIRNKFNDIKSNGNPGEFDYAGYCANKHIFQSAFLNANDWKPSVPHQSNWHTFFGHMGAVTRTQLKRYIHDSTSLGIAEALLIGYRSDIDPSVWQAYSNTGIVHIIAISGMHMAMIYMSIRWLLFLIPWMKRKRILSLGIAIACMWLFAGITGLPPSVTRAAIMFSLLGIGEMLDRDISGFNNLAASAFCLLCINPFWISDVGFQLSYLAVLSLMIFYSVIYHRLYIANPLLDAVWKLMAGTLAAQILTFPLCVYYFHQFPWLFLFTNLLAVPATTCILYAEIILVAFSSIASVATLLGTLISHSITWLNQGILFASRLPFAVWKGLQIDFFQMILLFVIVCVSGIWLMKKKSTFFPYALAFLLIFLCSCTWKQIETLQQKRFVVYNIPKQKSIEFIQGNKHLSPDDEAMNRDVAIKQYILQPSYLHFGIDANDTSIVAIRKSESLDLFQFGSTLIARVKRTNFHCKKIMPVDYLIFSEQSKPDVAWVQTNFSTAQIILDSSIPFWTTAAVKNEFSAIGIPVHVVCEDGAFEIGL